MRHPQWRCHKYTILLMLAGASLIQRSLAFAPSMARSALGRGHRMPGLPKISTIVPNSAASWRTDSLRLAMSDEGDVKDEDEEELEGLEEFYAQKAERERQQSLFNGGMFPGDFAPAKKASDEITIQEAKIETGTPQILVGFWKLYGSTGKGEDVSGRVILRADGQVIGGPTVRRTPDVEWSDPEGLQPVGGEWVVYKDPKNGRMRLNMTILLSREKKQQLEMDGVVMMVDTLDPETGESEPQPQIFGGISKRIGDNTLEAGEGDFSMMRMPTGEEKLIASVGSQQRRIW